MPKEKSVELPLSEITLRKYEKPTELKGKALTHRLCLSLGLLNPGDSRDMIVDIMHTLLYAKRSMSSRQIIEKIEKERKKEKKTLVGLTHVNICRQLRKLKQLMIVEVKADKYQLSERDSLHNIFNEKILPYYLGDIIERINLYLTEVEKNR